MIRNVFAVLALLAAAAGGATAHADDSPRTIKAWVKTFSPRQYPARLVSDLPGFSAEQEVKLDRYGALIESPARATGFFRTEKIDGRWWFISPEGNRYINVGVVSVKIPPTSAAAKKTAEAKFGSTETWREETIKLLRSYGFNATGSWSNDEELGKSSQRLVYTPLWNFMSAYGKKRGGTYQQPGHTGYPMNCIFAFDPEFENFCDEYAQRLAASKDDPYLLGHFSDNEMPFPLEALDNYLDLPPEDPGRKAAESFLQQRHPGRKESDSVTFEDREAFMSLLAERYFTVVSKAIRKYDPNHLYLGCRFHGTDHRNRALFEAAGKHVDVISYNLYYVWTPNSSTRLNWERWSGKPYMITEFYAKGADSGMGNRTGAGWTVPTQADRGGFYQHFTLSLLESRNCVGWHWFKYIDNDPNAKGTDPSNEDSNKGIVKLNYQPYTELLDRMRELNQQVYPLIQYFDSQASEKK